MEAPVVKVGVCRDMSKIDLTHMRHLYEAFFRGGMATPVSNPSEALGIDFLIGATHPACKSVVHSCYDPHAMPKDYDARPLWNRAYSSLYTPEELSLLLKDLEKVWERLGDWSAVKAFDHLDYVGFHAGWPFLEHLQPQLKHAKIIRIPISVPEWIFYPPPTDTRDYDVFFLGAVGMSHPIRRVMIRDLQSYNAIGIKSRWEPKHDVENWTCTRRFDEHQMWYADWLRRSKITPFDGSIWDWPTNRYFESMACGAMVLAPMPHDGDLLGFKDGVNMVTTNGHDLLDKIRYYLEHDSERRRIAENGAALCMRHHTSTARARSLITRFEKILDGTPVEEVEKQYGDEVKAWL